MTDRITCPWCGEPTDAPERDSDGIIYEYHTYETDCGECGQSIEAEATVNVTWSVARPNDDAPEAVAPRVTEATARGEGE